MGCPIARELADLAGPDALQQSLNLSIYNSNQAK